MSRSEFRWNKKRKHYAYLFKDKGDYRKNLLIHSDPRKKKGWNNSKQKLFEKKCVRLYRHPNQKKSVSEIFYIEKRHYVDSNSCFENRIYKWNWNKNDKRLIKRIKKGRRTR